MKNYQYVNTIVGAVADIPDCYTGPFRQAAARLIREPAPPGERSSSAPIRSPAGTTDPDTAITTQPLRALASIIFPASAGMGLWGISR